MPSRQVRRLAKHARLHLNDSRYTDADPSQFPGIAVSGDNFLDRVAHFVDYLIAAARDFRAGCDSLKHVAAAIHGGNAQVGAAQINSDGECRHFGIMTLLEAQMMPA
jgi:hypothetical protein